MVRMFGVNVARTQPIRFIRRLDRRFHVHTHEHRFTVLKESYTPRRIVWRQGAFSAVAYVAAGLLVVGLTGCSAAHLATLTGYAAMWSMEEGQASLVEQRLRAAEQQWHGTPYRWGGVSRDGVDCSGFVMNLYQDLFDLPLPRTTTEQVEAGEAAPPDALQAGDLVFFRTSRKTWHVGIYLSAGEFAHASTSQGVMTSRLDNAYWQEAYWTSRRILPTASAETAAASRFTMQQKKSSSKRRTGWK